MEAFLLLQVTDAVTGIPLPVRAPSPRASWRADVAGRLRVRSMGTRGSRANTAAS